LRIAAWSTGGPAIKDRFAALNAGSRRLVACTYRRRSGCSHNRRLVDRTGPGLRHHHAPRGQGSGWRRGMRMTLSPWGWGSGRIGRCRDFRLFSEGWRALLQYGGGGFISSRSGDCNGGRTSLNRSSGVCCRCNCHWSWCDRGSNWLIRRNCRRCGRRNSHDRWLGNDDWLLGCARMVLAGCGSDGRLRDHGYRWRHHNHWP